MKEGQGFDFSGVDKAAMVVAYCVAREVLSHVSAEVMFSSDFGILLHPKSETEVEWARRIQNIWNLRTEHPLACKERTSGGIADIVHSTAGKRVTFMQMMVLKQIHENVTPAQFNLKKLDSRLRPIWYALYWFLRSPDVFDWFIAAEQFLLATAAYRCGKKLEELRSQDVKDTVLQTFTESYDVDLGRKSVNTREQDTSATNYTYRNARNLRYAQIPAFDCHLECVEAMLEFLSDDRLIDSKFLTSMEEMRKKRKKRSDRPELERLFLLIEDTARELLGVNSFAGKNSAEMLLAVDSDRRPQVLECWRRLDFARGGSNTYEFFTGGKPNDRLLTEEIKTCQEDIKDCLDMLCRRGPLHYCLGSSHDSDAIALPEETAANIETVLQGLRPSQLAACKCASILKDIRRSQVTKPRRATADEAVVFATPVKWIRGWDLPERIQRLLQPSRFQPRVFGDHAVRKKGERRKVTARARQLARSLPQEAPAIVDDTADVLPSWVQGIHASHQPLLVGGIVGCSQCHSIVGKATIVRRRLARECAGIFNASSMYRFRRLALGQLPNQFNAWPDGLAEPLEARRVVRLIASGGQWRLE